MQLNLNKYLCLVALCVLSINTCLALVSPALEKPNYFHALWKGVITQSNSDTTGGAQYSVIIDIRASKYQVDYDSVKCGGHLELIEESENKLIFQEVITYGTSSCASGGKIILRRGRPGQASYEWVGSNNTSAKGILVNHKRQPSRAETCQDKTNKKTEAICM